MKKIFVFFLIFLIFLSGNATVSKNKYVSEDLEIRGVYISYLEYLTYFKGNSLSINKAYINKMLDNLSSININTIFLQVSPFSDSIYNSKIFPYSYTLTGVEGKNPGMDYLEYFIKEGKKRNIKIHAWINPYRISLTNDTNSLSKDNPAYSLLNTNSVSISDNGIYYNPASPYVYSLILKQVTELITNYNIAGIHFDDYFYPNNKIDLVNYENYKNKNKSDISISEYRLNVVNSLIKSVYTLIKDYNKDLIFSIAPDGNINNNYTYHFADVKTWLSDNNYVDLILPQVYYGFSNQYKPFINTLNEWHDLIKNDTKIVPVLAFYKVGNVDNQAGTGSFEWVNNKNIIKNQINFSKTLKKYQGYVLFRYDFLFNSNLLNEYSKEEIKNLKIINKKSSQK